MLKKFINIFLGGLFPLSIILISNSYNINITDIIYALIFILIISIIASIPLLFTFFKKKKYDLILIILIIVLSISSILFRLVDINSLPLKYSAVLWLIALVLSFSVVHFKLVTNDKFLTTFLSVFFISSLLIFFLRPIFENKVQVSDLTYNDVFENHKINENFQNDFNFFYIVLDGFPRLSNLEKVNYDTSKFRNLFFKNNLTVIENTKSDYVFSQKSISSTMNFGKIKPEINLEKKYFFEFIKNSKIVSLFAKNNYELFWFPSDISLSECPSQVKVNCIKSPYKIKILEKEIIKFYLGILQFQYHWVEKANMYYLTEIKKYNFRWMYHLDILSHYFNENFEQKKKFVFAHILIPHPPYLINSQCKLQKFALDYVLYDKKKILEQIDCLYIQLESFLNMINNKLPNSVLFIHSDHGSPLISEILYGEENFENLVVISNNLICKNNILKKKLNSEIIKSIMQCM